MQIALYTVRIIATQKNKVAPSGMSVSEAVTCTGDLILIKYKIPWTLLEVVYILCGMVAG